jgi:hypothetical protein
LPSCLSLGQINIVTQIKDELAHRPGDVDGRENALSLLQGVHACECGRQHDPEEYIALVSFKGCQRIAEGGAVLVILQQNGRHVVVCFRVLRLDTAQRAIMGESLGSLPGRGELLSARHHRRRVRFTNDFQDRH